MHVAIREFTPCCDQARLLRPIVFIAHPRYMFQLIENVIIIFLLNKFLYGKSLKVKSRLVLLLYICYTGVNVDEGTSTTSGSLKPTTEYTPQFTNSSELSYAERLMIKKNRRSDVPPSTRITGGRGGDMNGQINGYYDGESTQCSNFEFRKLLPSYLFMSTIVISVYAFHALWLEMVKCLTFCCRF